MKPGSVWVSALSCVACCVQRAEALVQEVSEIELFIIAQMPVSIALGCQSHAEPPGQAAQTNLHTDVESWSIPHLDLGDGCVRELVLVQLQQAQARERRNGAGDGESAAATDLIAAQVQLLQAAQAAERLHQSQCTLQCAWSMLRSGTETFMCSCLGL